MHCPSRTANSNCFFLNEMSDWQSAFADELSQEWIPTAQVEAEGSPQESEQVETVKQSTLFVRQDAPIASSQPFKDVKSMFSPLKLQTMFEPLDSTRMFTFLSLFKLTPVADMSDIPEESEQSTQSVERAKEFTFTCPPKRNSWKAMNHFLGHSSSDPSPMHSTPPQDSPIHSSLRITTNEQDVSTIDTPSKVSEKTPRALKLFQFAYDTFTKQHLESLVEEIEERAIPLNDFVQPEWEETSFSQSASQSQSEDLDERPSYRSAKRIRLSPETERHRDYTLPLATPRSAVRDRIRERRRAFPSVAANGTPYRAPLTSVSERTAFSLPLHKTPANAHRIEAVQEDSEEEDVQEEQEETEVVDQDQEEEATTANPVASRLQQAQALMDRIRSHPMERSTSTYEDSSSSSIEEPALYPAAGEKTTDLDDEPDLPRRMPRIQSPSASRQRITSRSSGLAASSTVVGSIRSSDKGTLKGYLQEAAAYIKTSPIAQIPVQEIQTDSKHSSLESKTSDVTALQQSKLAKQAEASLRKSLAQSSTSARLPGGIEAGSRRVSSATSNRATSNPSASTNKAKTGLNMTNIQPEHVEHILAQQQVASRMQFDQLQGKWVKLPKTQAGDLSVDSRGSAANLIEEDKSSSEDDIFAGIESFAADSAQQHQQQEVDDLPRPQLDDLSDGQLSIVEKDYEENGPMQLYAAAHEVSLEGIDEPDELLPDELHVDDLVPSPAQEPVANTSLISANSLSAKFRRPSSGDPLATPDVFGLKPLSRVPSNSQLSRPRSALKQRKSQESLDKQRSVSVSFSDGLKSGRLIDERPMHSTAARAGSALRYELIAPIQFPDGMHDEQEESPSKTSLAVPDLMQDASFRTIRIQQAVQKLGQSLLACSEL